MKSNPHVKNALLSYYQENKFNPVPIDLGNQTAWREHLAKRRRLYEHHLNIPYSMLAGCNVLEFGCNSGENALTMAYAGANLTLVEPNRQVWPRLKNYFKQYGLEKSIVKISDEAIDTFSSSTQFDIVIAEGFLETLPHREDQIQNIINLLKPGGVGVISFDDRFGSLLEITKRFVLWQVCKSEGVKDIISDHSLSCAKILFAEDFQALNASRPFEAWWKDELINPHVLVFWSYEEIIPLLEKGAVFHGSSPAWSNHRHYSWYKNIDSPEEEHSQLMKIWRKSLPFFIGGATLAHLNTQEANNEVINALSEFVMDISAYCQLYPAKSAPPKFPDILYRFFKSYNDPLLNSCINELQNIYSMDESAASVNYIKSYHQSKTLRSMWGTIYHYISFVKNYQDQ
jgi:SAM-dependent methyltransferase